MLPKEVFLGVGPGEELVSTDSFFFGWCILLQAKALHLGAKSSTEAGKAQAGSGEELSALTEFELFPHYPLYSILVLLGRLWNYNL